MRIQIAFCLLLLAGCSQSSLLTKQDYDSSQRAFMRGDASEALLDFPRGTEDGNFITTLEKGYLALIQGKPQITGLQKQAALLENQVRYHVSREARTFFYAQTPEDYYPSEHEIIWLHFLLSWGYSQQGKYEDACVEAREASSLLSLPWSPNGHFDDPTMRLFLAGLWTMCGEWHEAQVDLRAAWIMDNRLTWAKELAEYEQPPAHLFLVLGGPGPEPIWNPELATNPLRSERRISFGLRGLKSALSITDHQGKDIAAHLSPDAGLWYERHLARESELHEMILDSTYGTTATGAGIKASANILGATGKGIVRGAVTGVVVAMAIAAGGKSDSASNISSKDLVTLLAVGAVVGGVIGGVKGGADGYVESADDLKQEIDPSKRYRFVRYLPEYLWMGWSNQQINYPVELKIPSATIKTQQPITAGRSSVTVAFLPDKRQTSCSYKVERTSITVVTKPDATGNCPRELPSSAW